MDGYPRMLCLCIISAAYVFAMTSCHTSDAEGHIKARSREVLVSVCNLVWVAESVTGESPPTRLSSLVGWLEQHASRREPYIDYANKTVKDAWGSEIVLVTQDEKLLGVGSPGSDRKWENGQGDDILVRLEDVR